MVGPGRPLGVQVLSGGKAVRLVDAAMGNETAWPAAVSASVTARPMNLVPPRTMTRIAASDGWHVPGGALYGSCGRR